jgi:hypothetical protein
MSPSHSVRAAARRAFLAASFLFLGLTAAFAQGGGGGGIQRPGGTTTRESTAPAPSASYAQAGLYRAAGTNPDGSRYTGTVAITGDAGPSHFTWWINGQVFRGTGSASNGELVVEWGQPAPVIYRTGGKGQLDGRWASGAASETLNLYADAVSGPVTPGRYAVDGRNPDGSRYTGGAEISRDGDAYVVGWTVGGSNYRGRGTLTAGILVVDWGQATPAVYARAADGTLVGLWNNGDGEEQLRPVR